MMAFYDFPRVNQTYAMQLKGWFSSDSPSYKDYFGSQKCKTLTKASFDPLKKDKGGVKRYQSDIYKISEAAQKHLYPYEGGLNEPAQSNRWAGDFYNDQRQVLTFCFFHLMQSVITVTTRRRLKPRGSCRTFSPKNSDPFGSVLICLLCSN